MKPALLGAALGVLASAGAALAEEKLLSQPVAVVELFTSQGCSSCPPADEYLRRLAVEPGVIALALHVDYWDYIGWPDSFANPHYTERQKAYARAEGSRMIYTPQMIVDGTDRVAGTDPASVETAIKRHQKLESPIALKVQRKGEHLQISAEPHGTVTGPLSVQVVRFKPQAKVEIGQGENAGRVIEYANIVTAWQELQDWDGSAPLALETEVAGSDPVVVILQADGPGPILAAALAE